MKDAIRLAVLVPIHRLLRLHCHLQDVTQIVQALGYELHS